MSYLPHYNEFALTLLQRVMISTSILFAAVTNFLHKVHGAKHNRNNEKDNNAEERRKESRRREEGQRSIKHAIYLEMHLIQIPIHCQLDLPILQKKIESF